MPIALVARFLALVGLVALIDLVALACTPAPQRAGWVEAAPSGDVAALVNAQRQVSAGKGRRVVVYVGASWCEPCRYFHDAAARGDLDDLLGRVDLLSFDLDRDGARLEASGYGSRMIPLLVVPGADGRGTDRRMEGSVKGDGAVAEMRPRLRALLAP